MTPLFVQLRSGARIRREQASDPAAISGRPCRAFSSNRSEQHKPLRGNLDSHLYANNNDPNDVGLLIALERGP